MPLFDNTQSFYTFRHILCLIPNLTAPFSDSRLVHGVAGATPFRCTAPEIF